MDSENAENISKFVGQTIEKQLKEFLEKNAIEKLESIHNKLHSNNPLNKLLSETILEWRKSLEIPDPPYDFGWIDFRLSSGQMFINENFYEHFLFFNVLLSLYSKPTSPLFPEHRTPLLKKSKLTPKKFKTALLDIFDNRFDKVKRGGSDGFWSENKKLEFLAMYNRFLIVIKNVRKTKREVLKKTKSEPKIENELLTKYEVPNNLIKSLFSEITPREVALDWAIAEMKLEHFNRDYLDGVILKQARKLWRNKGVLIDVLFELGSRKLYAFDRQNKAVNKSLKDDLRYTGVNKISKKDTENAFANLIESGKPASDFFKLEKYLVEWSSRKQ